MTIRAAGLGAKKMQAFDLLICEHICFPGEKTIQSGWCIEMSLERGKRSGNSVERNHFIAVYGGEGLWVKRIGHPESKWDDPGEAGAKLATWKFGVA
ncbi:hypothetical protein [Celeribacter sp. ULVN23_4]